MPSVGVVPASHTIVLSPYPLSFFDTYVTGTCAPFAVMLTVALVKIAPGNERDQRRTWERAQVARTRAAATGCHSA
jgi:hypothetical protein